MLFSIGFQSIKKINEKADVFVAFLQAEIKKTEKHEQSIFIYCIMMTYGVFFMSYPEIFLQPVIYIPKIFW